MDDPKKKPDSYWQEKLTPEQYNVCRKGGTERAFTGLYHDTKTPGVYRCSCCHQELFSSDSKYNSGTGWPSFWEPISEAAVTYKTDRSWFMVRTEVLCANCGAHLGPVLDGGPDPTGKRFCINSVALDLKERVK